LNKKLKFEVESAEIISEEPSSEFATARITAFSDGVSRHDTICDADTLKKTAHTIYETPLIYEYDKRFSDFGTHPNGAPIIAGFVVPDSAEFYERDDGTQRTSLSVTAKIWKRYATQFIEIFKRDGSKKRSVSVEMEVRDSVEEGNLIRLKDWVYTAICVLGEFVTEASPGAELEMLSFAEKSNQEYTHAYELEFGRYDDLSFKIPSSVKSAAKQGLELRSKLGRGGTSVGLATARYLVKNDTATPEKVRHVAKYFPRHAGDNLDDKESNGWIAWLLWGSDAGRRWSTALVKKMNELDDKKMSYFADENIDENENLQNSDEETIVVDNYLGIDSQNEENTEIGGQENNMAEKVEKTEEEVEEKEFNYAELFADEKFAQMFAEVEEDEEGEEKEETEKESYAKAKEEFASGKNPAAVMSAMYSAMKRMSKRFAAMKEKMAKKDEDNKVYLAENEDLKKRFAEQEEKEKEMAVSDFMKDMSAKVEMSDEQANEMKEKAKEYSFAQLDAWKNEVKAFAFDFKPKTQNEEDNSINRYALDYAGVKAAPKNDVWAELNK